LQESSSDSRISEGSVKQRDPRLKKLEQVSSSKTDTDNADSEKLEEEPPATASVPAKPVEKVGFDLEFVPLDKDDSSAETPSVVYNRDRPLGKNRYFRKDPKAKITKSDSDSGSDFADKKESRDGKKRSRGIEHRNYRQRHAPCEENEHEHETVDERKKSGRGRGRRRLSGDRPGEDRSGEPTAGHDRADGRDHRPVEQPENGPGRPEVRPDNRVGGRRGHREHSNRLGEREHLGNRRGRRAEEHSGRGRPLPKHSDDRTDIGHRHPARREHDEYDNMHGGRHERRGEWTRGRGQPRYETAF
jgi:hypothetical protein